MSANQYSENVVLTSGPSNAEKAVVWGKVCHKSQNTDQKGLATALTEDIDLGWR